MRPLKALNESARALVTVAVGVVLAVGATMVPTVANAATPATNQCVRSVLLVPSCGVLWGAYHPWVSGSNWAAIQAGLEAQIGRNVDISYHYHDFSGANNANGQIPDADERTLAASGHIIFDDWGTQIFSTGKQLQWADIAAGDYDSSEIIPAAKSVKAFGQPIMISIDHEMDALVGTSGTAADYVAAYRHIVDVFAAQGVTNVIWVWTTTGYSGRYSMFNSLYPGDAYVDWIGYDPYNFAGCHNSAWKSFSQTIDPMYQWLEANGYGDKPFILPEYGTMPNPSDSTATSAWYAGVPAGLAAHPNIKAAVEWDDSTGNCNSTLTNDPGELNAFAAAGLSPQVLGTTTPPVAPAAPTVTATSTTTADVSWTAVPGATSYQLQRAAAGSTTFSNVGTASSATTVHDSGLTPGSSESYQVIASNAGGASAASPATTVTLLPGQPGTLTFNDTATTEIDLSWGSAVGATSYDVRKDATGSGTFSTDLGTVTGTTFADTGLTPGASANYEVLPVDAAGAGAASNTASATTLPAQVVGLTANASSPTEVDLSWAPATGATTYSVERSPSGASSWSVLASGATATTYTDTSVSPVTAYDYRVVATGVAGKGAYSTTQTVTTPVLNTALLSNGFEGGTNGSPVTVANSGGASGNALNNVVCSAGTATYSTTSPAHGNVAVLLSPTTKLCYLEWNSKSMAPATNIYGRAYINLSADPTGAFAFIKGADSAFARDAQVNLSKTGKLSILDSSATPRVTFAQPIPLHQWVRLEWHLVTGSSGSFELRMYNGDSTTPIESHLVTGINTGTSVGAMQVGTLSSLASGYGTTIGVDSLADGTTTWLGAAS